jgi:LPXTG-motif cell wall-anchored protein
VCADGVLSVVTDDSGVQHQACVASAAETPVAPVPPTPSALVRRTTTTATTQSDLPATGNGTDGLVIAALLVGSGSVVSLLSRRRPAVHRKGFRRRGLTS